MTADSDCIALTGDGTTGAPLTAAPVIDPAPGNALTCGPGGLMVTPARSPATTSAHACRPGTGSTTTRTPASSPPVRRPTQGTRWSSVATAVSWSRPGAAGGRLRPHRGRDSERAARGPHRDMAVRV
ncbi:hypothetical protein ACR6C2_07600 [Streptomyces sp. INA 01156]